MLQIYVAWYQLISSHPTSCIAACWGLGDDPFPQTGPTHSTGAGGGLSLFYLYPMPILLSLCYLIWYSFQYLILTYILVTYFSIHASLARNQLSSSYPTSCSAAGWKLDDPHPFPGPTHSTGGRGGWWVMTMTMAGGVGGGPGTWNMLPEQETKTNAWKIQKLGSNKILGKAACCNHILSGQKSHGMSHLNQTSESLWATINSDVSSRNSTHKRFLGSFLLQSLLNKSTPPPWNQHHPWMLLANIANTVFNWIVILYILLGHEVLHVVFTEWTRWTLFAQFDSGSRSMKLI